MSSADNDSDCFLTTPVPPFRPCSVACFLCDETQQLSKYRDHLTHDHGVVHEVEFMVQLSLHKQIKSRLPSLIHPGAGPILRPSLIHSSTQTVPRMTMEEVVCVNCRVEDTETDCSIDKIVEEDEVCDVSKDWGNMRDMVIGSSTCDICQRVCLDLAGHLRLSHKLTMEDYLSTTEQGTSDKEGEVENAPLPTDLRCYFKCGEVFKKDYQLKLHLKLKHSMEDPEELKRAEMAAQQEIELTRRSGARLQCALCPLVLSSKSSLWNHVTTKHNITYQAYKAEHGDSEQGEQAVFECKICHSNLKHERTNVTRHLKGLHGINWGQYMALVRGEGKGLDRLPLVARVQCKVCGNNVKYLKSHLKRSHRISMEEYTDFVDSGGPVSLPEVEIFQCEICDSKVKCFKEHLKITHHITEKEYEDVLANKKTLPPIETVICEICKTRVKHFPSHLRNVHRIKMSQYEELAVKKVFEDEVKLGEIQSNVRVGDRIEKPPEDLKTGDSICDGETNLRESLSFTSSISFPLASRVSASKPSKAEIKDRSNTRCSPCQMELGSRLKFINHCQMIHKINIKTKTGRVVPFPIPEPDLKTLEESFSSDQETDSIYLKAYRGVKRESSYDPSSIDEAGIKGVKKIKRAGGEESAHCNQCNNMFSSVGKMEQHKSVNCRGNADKTLKIEDGVPCDGCGKLFANKANIKRHKRFSCSHVLQDQ